MYILGSPRQRTRGWSEPRTFLLTITGPKERRQQLLGF